jgi:Family of unknown function (DUF6454)
MTKICRFAFGLLASTVIGSSAVAASELVAERVQKLTRAVRWRPVATIPINFKTHHPQGMIKIGDTFFVSSVEITVPTTRFPEPKDGFDRDTGQGAGHLFKIDAKGNLLGSVKLGEGAMYHPGGIDYDGRHVWVAVAEYRPNSRSIIYRVDPQAMAATEVFRFDDHIGGIVHNIDDKTLHGVSWGSRRIYKWTLGGDGKVTNTDTPPDKLRVPNRSHYIDYQDCHYLGGRRMLCSGLNNYRLVADGPVFPLGGLEIVDLKTDQAVYQVPVELWAPSGKPMTQNPFWVEATESGLRAYFMPDDDNSTLFVYEAAVK